VLGRTAGCACDHRTHRPNTGCYQRVTTGRTVLLPGCDQRVRAFDNPARHFWRNGTPEGRGRQTRTMALYHVHASVISKGKSPSGSMGATGQSTIAPARSSVSVCTRRAPQRLCGACRTANACPSFLPHGSEGLFLAWRAPGCVQAAGRPGQAWETPERLLGALSGSQGACRRYAVPPSTPGLPPLPSSPWWPVPAHGKTKAHA